MPETSSGPASYVDYGSQFSTFYDRIFPRGQVSQREIEWIVSQLPDSTTTIVELGVGTGRIAIPVKESLIARASRTTGHAATPDYVGVDISQEMLDELKTADSANNIVPLLADISSVEYPEAVDAVICVCGTISMLTDPALQARTIRRAAAALNPGGMLIVETHNPEAVRQLHVYPSVTWCVPYPGNRAALVSFSTLSGTAWHVEHCWIDDGTAAFLSEDSRLTTLDELEAFAVAAGLSPVSRTSGLTGIPVSETSASVCAVFQKLP